MRSSRALATLVLAVCALAASTLSPRALSAQRASWSVVPEGAPLRVLAERRFDQSSGLRAPTVYAMATDRDGMPWLAAEDGVYSYAAGSWRREVLPDEFINQQVRSLVFASDGSAWFGTRRGVIHRSATGAIAVYRDADGIPGPVIYSVTESRAIDGTPRIVVGASRGIAWFDGKVFKPVTIDSARPWVGVMVTDGVGVDGAPALWVANSTGGIALVQRNRTTKYGAADGLQAPDAQFVVPMSDDARTIAYIATQVGVYAAERRGARLGFTLIPGSPRDAYRIASVADADGRRTLWAGTATGFLSSWDGSRWTPIEPGIDERRSVITMLRPVAGHGGSNAVYVGARNNYLLRVSFGSAARVDLGVGRNPLAITSLFAEADGNGRDALWAGTQEDSVIVMHGDGRVAAYPLGPTGIGGHIGRISRVDLAPPVRGTVGPPAAARSRTSTIVAVAEGKPWRFVGSRFERFDRGLDDVRVSEMRRVALPQGGEAVLAATSRGVWEWSGTAWSWVPAYGTASVSTVADGNEDQHAVLYLGGDHQVRVVSANGIRVEELPMRGTASIGVGPVVRVCRTQVGMNARVWAHDYERGVFWRNADSTGQWQLLSSTVTSRSRASDALGVVSLTCLANGRIATSSFSGVSVVDVGHDDPRRWRVLAQLSDADGLPTIQAGELAASADTRYVWTATGVGLGVIDLVRATRPLNSRLTVRLTNGVNGVAMSDDAVMSRDIDDMLVDPMLLTYHREEATRYRVKLERLSSPLPWVSDGAVGPDTGEVLEIPERMFHDLDPGRYELSVSAVDWAGRSYGPITRHFSMPAPPFITWPALLAYLALIVSGLTLAYRWRVQTIRNGAERALASERRARESERRFRTLFEEAVDAHVLIEGGVVQAANREAAALFGVAEPSMLNGKAIDAMLDGAATPASAVPTELLVRRDDLLVPVQCLVTTLTLEGRDVSHWVLRDLTDVRRAEAERAWFESQVREAQKLESLGTLAGGVAHDFNNLLGVIRGNAELGRGAIRKGRSNDDNLAAILDASDRARDIVRQILTFSRRSSPVRETVSLSRVVTELTPLLRRLVPRSVRFQVEGADAPRVIQGDPTQLQQLLLNLVSNAAYALRTREEGVITISLSDEVIDAGQPAPTGNVVVLRVTDNGDGMTEAVRARIFEPFFTTKPTGEGTGLGMAVVHGIVMSHEGHPEVVSTLGEGTTFTLRFPAATIAIEWDEDEIDPEILAEAEAARREFEDVPEDTPAYLGTRIVVVDDEPTVAQVVERALQQHGHHVQVFHAPETALAFITAQPHAIDLLITDQTMPGMTGDQLAGTVKGLRPDLPILIVTGYSHHLTPARIAEAGVRAVLQKPLALDALKRAVDDALANLNERSHSR